MLGSERTGKSASVESSDTDALAHPVGATDSGPGLNGECAVLRLPGQRRPSERIRLDVHLDESGYL